MREHNQDNAELPQSPAAPPQSALAVSAPPVTAIGLENHEPTPHLQNGENSTGATAMGEVEDGKLGIDRKRKLLETDKSDRLSRGVSPPWKRIAVDGPTSFVVDGRRKSSRTNQVPLTMQPPSSHRKTRAAQSTVPVSSKAKPAFTNGKSATLINGHRSSPKVGKYGRRSLGTAPVAQPKPSPIKLGRKSLPTSAKLLTAPKGTRRSQRTLIKDESDADDIALDESAHATSISRRERRLKSSQPPEQPEKQSSPQSVRLRIRFHNPVLTRQHPSHFATRKTTQSFGEWLAEDNPLEEDGVPRSSYEIIQRDAQIRMRIVKASEPGGALSEGICTRLAIRPSKEPLKRYANWDFICAHATHFSTLMRQEISSHKKNAARLVRAAKEAIQVEPRWAFLREAKSKEEIFKEEYGYQIKRYKQVVKDMDLKWLMVIHEVNRIKLAQWEKEQEVLGNKALDDMLDQSTSLLRRQFRDTSEFTSEDMTSRAQSTLHDVESAEVDGDMDMSDDDATPDPDDNSRGYGMDADSDADLTREELMEKYGNLPDVEISDDEESGSEENDSDIHQSVEGEDSDGEDEEDEEEEDDQEPVQNEGEPSIANAPTVDDEPYMNGTTEVHVNEGDSFKVETPAPNQDDDTADYSNVKIEEVDETLLDDSDEESTDMSDDNSEIHEEFEEESDDEEPGGLSGLLGLYLTKEEIVAARQEVTEDDEPASEAGSENIEEPHDEDPSAIADVEGDTAITEIDDMEQDTSEMESVEDVGNRSTPLPHDAAVSTPTTSIVPATPNLTRTEVSPLLRGTLREYQHDGVDWLAKLYSGGRNGILADEMGLGKTIQTIALLAHLATHHEVWGPHLIVVPTSVILNWEMEFKKWCPAFRILTYYGNIEERKAKRRGWTNDDMWNVCITSYQLILQDAQAFKKRSWHYLVLDEAHNIKNFQTQRWQTLLTFRTHSRLLLTGTPLQNNLQELWSLLYFLMPAGIDGAGFAELETFLNSLKKPADQILDQGRQQLDPEAQARVSKLHEVLRPYLLRRLKSEVEKQMPLKYEHVVYCRLSKRQRQLYDEFMGRADTRRTLSSGNYMSIINCLMSLRKVCNHPDLFETRQIVTSFAMQKSAVAQYEIKELIVRRKLLRHESLDLEFADLLPTVNERYRKRELNRIAQLQASKKLLSLATKERQRLEELANSSKNQSALSRIAIEAQWNMVRDLENRSEHAQRAAEKSQVYGKDLIEFMTLPSRFDPPRPTRKRPNYSHGDWFLDKSLTASSLMPGLMNVASKTQIFVTKFGAVTPAVVAEDVARLTLSKTGVETVQLLQERARVWDPYHEARVRLSIAFPDKRLLQYDCGKLQALDKLLRELQAGGHRCLIFTQMTKVLDILEQFLNIHGHRYLRLDGTTKIEQRQILTDRFNNDTRILAFILSSRSGGLGINLTGADTVIFYDLDWNPAMDKQCQDRCHRIGQTRDVHIYRFVSEYTIEANILRKSNQKRLLDDVIIQRGEFTTDTFFNRTVSYRDALDDILEPATASGDDASAAMDRVLGDLAGIGSAVLETVEDKEDAAAARVAQKEMVVADDMDFKDSGTALTNGGAAAVQNGDDPAAALDAAIENAGGDADGEMPHVDDYMLRFMKEEMKYVIVRPPKQKSAKIKKKGGLPDWKRNK
jgi:helicase SWR1